MIHLLGNFKVGGSDIFPSTYNRLLMELARRTMSCDGWSVKVGLHVDSGTTGYIKLHYSIPFALISH